MDRVFTMKGFGTVVTGTMVSDHIKTGEEIEILPGGITARIRGIQVHNQPVEEAWSGQRTAINLQGIEKSSIGRGDVLVRPKTVWPSNDWMFLLNSLHLILKILKTGARPPARRHKRNYRAHNLLEKDELAPGQKSLLNWFWLIKMCRFRRPFVLRSYSPITTIGGGQIIDPLPETQKTKR